MHACLPRLGKSRLSGATIACPHCGAVSSAQATLCYNCGGELRAVVDPAAAERLSAGSGARAETDARRYAAMVTLLFAGLFFCGVIGSMLSSFDAPSPAWLDGPPGSGRLFLVAFVVFFSGLGVGVFRAMHRHEWSAWGNVAVIAAACVGGFFVGLWIGPSYPDSDFLIPGSSRASFALMGAAVMTIGFSVLVWFRSRRWNAAGWDV